jgi:hypothetical protein
MALDLSRGDAIELDGQQPALRFDYGDPLARAGSQGAGEVPGVGAFDPDPVAVAYCKEVGQRGAVLE